TITLVGFSVVSSLMTTPAFASDVHDGSDNEQARASSPQGSQIIVVTDNDTNVTVTKPTTTNPTVTPIPDNRER
ncbi:MAG: hypothetical protein WCQ26_07715, partial [Pseudanabaena sp. ELA748]